MKRYPSRPGRRRAATLAATVIGIVLSTVLGAAGVTSASAATGVDDRATLWFIQTSGTASGRIEVHSATAASRYQSADLHAATVFRTTEARQGFFQMVGRDLWFLKVCETGSGLWELHSATAASGYRSGAHIAFSGVDAPVASLGCDQQKAALSRTRVHIFFPQGERTYPNVSWFTTDTTRVVARVSISRPGGTYATCSGELPVETRGTYGTAYDAQTVQQYGRAHPTFLRLSATASGRIEYVTYGRDLSYSYVCASVPYGSSATTSDRPTAFSTADGGTGVTDVRDVTGDGIADVTLVKTVRPGTGRVEVFVAPGATPGTLSLASPTWFSPGLAGLGTWQLGSAAN